MNVRVPQVAELGATNGPWKFNREQQLFIRWFKAGPVVVALPPSRLSQHDKARCALVFIGETCIKNRFGPVAS